MDAKKILDGIYNDHADLLALVREDCSASIQAAGEAIVATLANGATVFACGNGGSAADSQHFCAEIVGQFQIRGRAGLPAIALTVDSSAMTSIANDFGYERIFARQVEALCRPGDVLVGITTSGTSGNVLAAIEKAHAMGVATIGLVGGDPSRMAPVCAHVVAVPSRVTARVQEIHIMIIHAWCQMIDERFGAI